MWMMLQQEKPEDYDIATGENHSVREFVELAFSELGIEIEWQGEGLDEVGFDRATGQAVIKIDPRYFRPSEVDFLLGNPEKARKKLGWNPKTSFRELVKMMIERDYQTALEELKIIQIGA
jgi:GDPmannose 4,6-dehydratase